MTTRSTALYVGRLPASTGVLGFTCPDDHIVIVKSVEAQNHAVVSALVSTNTQRSGGGDPHVTMLEATINSGQAGAWSGWRVLAPGDQVWLYADQADVDVWISGAELPSPV